MRSKSLALRALAQQALGDTERALNHLERALSLAEPEGYVRTFVDEGASMAQLLPTFGSRRRHPRPSPKLHDQLAERVWVPQRRPTRLDLEGTRTLAFHILAARRADRP